MKKQILCIYGFLYKSQIDINFNDFILELKPVTQSFAPSNNMLYLNMYSYIDETNIAILNKSMLEEILTFINQGQVIIEIFDFENTTYEPNIDQIIKDPRLGKITLHKEYQTNGRIIHEQNITDLINLFLDNDNINKNHLNKLLSVNAERFNMKKQYMDINYLIMMIGIESIARDDIEDYDSSLGKIVSQFLNKFNFNIEIENISNKFLAGNTYAHLRNGIAHNGMLYKNININGDIYKYELELFYSNFICIFCLLILKMANYNDTSINWDCWKESESPLRKWFI